MITLWDTSSGREVRSLKGHDDLVHDLAFSPDGKRLFSSSWDHGYRLGSVDQSENPYVEEGHRVTVDAIAVSPNGRLLVSGSRDGALKSWDIEAARN